MGDYLHSTMNSLYECIQSLQPVVNNPIEKNGQKIPKGISPKSKTLMKNAQHHVGWNAASSGRMPVCHVQGTWFQA